MIEVMSFFLRFQLPMSWLVPGSQFKQERSLQQSCTPGSNLPLKPGEQHLDKESTGVFVDLLLT